MWDPTPNIFGIWWEQNWRLSKNQAVDQFENDIPLAKETSLWERNYKKKESHEAIYKILYALQRNSHIYTLLLLLF